MQERMIKKLKRLNCSRGDGNDAQEIYLNDYFDQKLNYIHQNPVKAELVNRAEDYRYSSAIDYAGGKGLLDVMVV